MPEIAMGFADTAINSSSKIPSLMRKDMGGKGLDKGKEKRKCCI